MPDPIHYIPITAPPLVYFSERGSLVLAPRYVALAEPFRTAVEELAADVNGRWCFNCAARVGYTEEEGLPMSRAWWPVQLLACGGEVTVVCLGCADPFGDGR